MKTMRPRCWWVGDWVSLALVRFASECLGESNEEILQSFHVRPSGAEEEERPSSLSLQVDDASAFGGWVMMTHKPRVRCADAGAR